MREVRSSTNLVSSYRTTKKSISFYFFARRHRKGIQQFYMFICLRKGRNPSFGTDVQLVSFGSAAAIRALWICWGARLRWCPKAVPISNQTVTIPSFVSLHPWCKFLCTAEFRGEPSTQLFLLLPICLAWFCTLPHLSPKGLHRNSSPIATAQE